MKSLAVARLPVLALLLTLSLGVTWWRWQCYDEAQQKWIQLAAEASRLQAAQTLKQQALESDTKIKELRRLWQQSGLLGLPQQDAWQALLKQMGAGSASEVRWTMMAPKVLKAAEGGVVRAYPLQITRHFQSLAEVGYWVRSLDRENLALQQISLKDGGEAGLLADLQLDLLVIEALWP